MDEAPDATSDHYQACDGNKDNENRSDHVSAHWTVSFRLARRDAPEQQALTGNECGASVANRAPLDPSLTTCNRTLVWFANHFANQSGDIGGYRVIRRRQISVKTQSPLYAMIPQSITIHT